MDKTLPTNQIPFIGDYVRIVCALSNKFFPPLSKCKSPDDDNAEAAKLLYLSKQVLAFVVIQKSFSLHYSCFENKCMLI